MAWLNRIVIPLVWIVATAGVSFYVARNAATEENRGDVTAPLPPVALEQRATVSLETKTIVPVVSANGTVVRYGDAWMLEAPATSDNLAYRLLDPPVAVRAQIKGGPSGFACAWVGLGQSGVPGSAPAGDNGERDDGAATPVAVAPDGAAESAPRQRAAFVPLDGDGPGGPAVETPEVIAPVSTGGVTLRCAIPDDVRVAAGMLGLMVLQMDRPVDARALPVTAVVGSVERGQVVVVRPDGATELRAVQLGVSDSYNIAITGGLAPDEVVLRNPTQTDFSQAERGD